MVRSKMLILCAVLAATCLIACSQERPAAGDAASAAAEAPPAAVRATNPLAAWTPSFDASGAEYVLKVASVAHPAIAGVSAAYRIRDQLWQASGGRIYYDFYPLGQLGGEVEQLNQLMLGGLQGMLCSSVAVTNIAPRMGVVNLPFLVNTFDKLDTFVGTPELFDPFRRSTEEKGVMTVDVTGYGGYGWATVQPVASLADARPLKFRIAEAAVNKSLYQQWGLNAVVMPWPDVPVALKQRVIDGLDHTPIVCSLSKKFEEAKFYTRINYAQGLYIHLLNRAWFDRLPADLQEVVQAVIRDECARTRSLTRAEEEREVARAASESGVTFAALPAVDVARLRQLGDAVHEEWAPAIGPDYLQRVQRVLDYGE